jgi:hypothetical protein
LITVPVLIALLILSNSAAFARGIVASSFAPGHHFAHFDHFRRHFPLSATAIGLG